MRFWIPWRLACQSCPPATGAPEAESGAEGSGAVLLDLVLGLVCVEEDGLTVRLRIIEIKTRCGRRRNKRG
jgi:hypothetical protein